MRKDLFRDLIVSIKEAREMGLIMEDKYCEVCDRLVPNKNYITSDGCLWCDPKGEKNDK